MSFRRERPLGHRPFAEVRYAGTYRQTTEPTPAQRQILALLDMAAPPRILQLDAATD